MFESYREKVEALDMVPLRVECHLNDIVISTNGLHLDSILSYAVVQNETRGEMLGGNADYVRVPLPLKELWTSPRGVPLWASTDLMPVEEAAPVVRYWHRRGIESHMSKKNHRFTAGPGKELRGALPGLANQILAADCIGNADEIAALLVDISSIGKKHHTSGAVKEWRIYQIAEFSLWDNQGVTRRSIPGAYSMLHGHGMPFNTLQYIGFSPPYWHVACRDMCIPTGVK